MSEDSLSFWKEEIRKATENVTKCQTDFSIATEQLRLAQAGFREAVRKAGLWEYVR